MAEAEEIKSLADYGIYKEGKTEFFGYYQITASIGEFSFSKTTNSVEDLSILTKITDSGHSDKDMNEVFCDIPYHDSMGLVIVNEIGSYGLVGEYVARLGLNMLNKIKTSTNANISMKVTKKCILKATIKRRILTEDEVANADLAFARFKESEDSDLTHFFLIDGVEDMNMPAVGVNNASKQLTTRLSLVSFYTYVFNTNSFIYNTCSETVNIDNGILFDVIRDVFKDIVGNFVNMESVENVESSLLKSVIIQTFMQKQHEYTLTNTLGGSASDFIRKYFKEVYFPSAKRIEDLAVYTKELGVGVSFKSLFDMVRKQKFPIVAFNYDFNKINLVALSYDDDSNAPVLKFTGRIKEPAIGYIYKSSNYILEDVSPIILINTLGLNRLSYAVNPDSGETIYGKTYIPWTPLKASGPVVDAVPAQVSAGSKDDSGLLPEQGSTSNQQDDDSIDKYYYMLLYSLYLNSKKIITPLRFELKDRAIPAGLIKIEDEKETPFPEINEAEADVGTNDEFTPIESGTYVIVRVTQRYNTTFNPALLNDNGNFTEELIIKQVTSDI